MRSCSCAEAVLLPVIAVDGPDVSDYNLAMRFASALHRSADLDAAVNAAADEVGAQLGGKVDLLFPFLRTTDPNDYRRLPELLEARFPGATLFGCAAKGVIGGGHEEEDGPALSLTAAVLPGARLVHLDPESIMDGEVMSEKRLAAELGPVPAGVDALVLVDPFSVQPDQLAAALDLALPHAVKVGALATAGPVPRSTMLYGHTAHRRGALVLLLPHEVRIRPIVAQGCRPVGRAHVITRRDGQAILELDGKPALAAMKDCYASLSAHDRELFRHSLFVGVEMDRGELEARPDRLLVRNLLGVDPEREAFGVAAELHDYDVVQFVLRDSASAAEELTSLLTLARDGGATPAGALLFTCVGRGRHLFAAVDHDPRLFGDAFANVPVGGCFSDGEIAPVGGKTFLHAYTSAFALIEQRR